MRTTAFKARLSPTLLLLAATLGCGRVHGEADKPTAPDFVLTQEEIRLARELAERDLDVPRQSTAPRELLLYIKTDLMPDGQADGSERLVMVHHYRYAGDQTIFTLVDLRNLHVLRREVQEHYPTALANVEVTRAETLARADGRLQGIFNQGAAVDARPIQFSSPAEPLFGHRVVHVLLRQGGHYLVSPRVLVDLTTETVHLD